MKVHFIGIGGIGVSALAQYYLKKGHEVSGSDLTGSDITDFMARKGAKIMLGQRAENITSDIDLVVYSPAVQNTNPEFARAKELGIKMQSYPEALGELTKQYYTVAVSGSHGKSTTTAMIALVLIKAGLDPTVIVGTKVREFGNSNFRAGNSKYLVIEACEYDSSFLHYLPKITVVTNVDKEHLDYFKNFDNVKKAFKNFVAKLPESGFAVLNKDDKINSKIQIPNSKKNSNSKFQTVEYSLKQIEAKKVKKILKIPGRHNVSNGLAVLSVARILDIPDKITFNALSEFKGTWRRFEEINSKKLKNLKIISDYAHHPNEIKATLKAAREKYPKKFILLVFQPHQHQRTHYLFDDFVKIFRMAIDSRFIDEVILTDIYDVAGRETKKISAEINSEKLVEKIKRNKVFYLPKEKLEEKLKPNPITGGARSGDILIIMGAGDIYKLADKF